jgi:glycosyltransferase involved in cell wall biosynthesis
LTVTGEVAKPANWSGHELAKSVNTWVSPWFPERQSRVVATYSGTAQQGNHVPRLLLLVDNAHPLSDSGECGAVAAALRAAGHAVELIELGLPSAEVGVSSPSISLPVRPDGRCRVDTIRTLRRLIRQFEPDQICCWGKRAMVVGPLAGFGSAATLTAIHESSLALIQHRRSWRKRLCWSRFERHLVRSEHLLPEVRQCFAGWQVDRLPWTQPQPPGKFDRQAFRRGLGIPGQARLVGLAAQLRPDQRIKDFIWAGDLMACIRDDVYWLVIGEGPHAWRLQRFARQLEIGSHLKFLGWHPDAAAILGSLDVYVQASAGSESCTGMAMALRQGIPQVGLIDPVHRQFVRHGYNGFLVERGARNEIARCVNRLVNRTDVAEEFSQNARQLGQQLLVSPGQAAARILGGSLPQASAVAGAA